MFIILQTFQSQFRFDNECNLNLPDNHKRVSDDPPATSMTLSLTASDARTVSILFVFFSVCMLLFSSELVFEIRL